MAPKDNVWTHVEIVQILAWVDHYAEIKKDFKKTVARHLERFRGAGLDPRSADAIETQLVKYKKNPGKSTEKPHISHLKDHGGTRCLKNLQPGSEDYDEDLAKEVKEAKDKIDKDDNSSAPVAQGVNNQAIAPNPRSLANVAAQALVHQQV